MSSIISQSSLLSSKFDVAYQYLMKRLEAELPAYLTYHNAEHTKGVIKATEYLARKEGVTEDDLTLLRTAALYHDAGFLEGYTNHEELSCKLAKKDLPAFDYSTIDIETICQLIACTRLPHTPTTHLQKILCDADLFYLGSDDYFPTAENLFKEFKHIGIIKTWKEWQGVQKAFLENHHFHTKTAGEERSSAVKHNQYLLKTNKGSDQVSTKRSKRINHVQDFFLIVFGVLTAGFALKGFLMPNSFFDGGVTGISLLLHDLFNFNLAIVIVLANIPLIAIGYFTISRRFALRTMVCVLLLGVCLWYFPYPVITSDKLLVSVFGGFFLGMGIGFTMRAGCALDGVEVLALYTFKRTSFTITEIILGINILIFCVAAFKFGMETALYSILTYFTASRTIDYVVEGLEAYTGVTIISSHSNELKQRLVNELGRGITVYKGERGFLPGNFEASSDCDIIFTVITRLELRRLKNLIYETDPKAFVFANTVKEASGGILKRRHAH